MQVIVWLLSRKYTALCVPRVNAKVSAFSIMIRKEQPSPIPLTLLQSLSVATSSSGMSKTVS